ncbi:Gfo/Idh/MocA family protein [Paenibacillus macerans]|uniref:Gfo/Idh/MocA family protein n=1 Tax=Paenibacillus macerans TaxID=44252 RepID=UPI00203FFA1B|nr:Gfo/Idh/MocA family oxidoreductase [Paenibacillus macerans]MCM3699375.1 Gfo/Idh/MocA family oxidoreductase [Paenibacillus macerans]
MACRVALIGAGIISGHHLEAIARMGPERLTAVAVADTDEAKGRAAVEKYGLAFYPDYRDMVREQRPDIVIIALPHYLHEECAVFCAAHGCHLLLEKPMALNVAQCDAILTAASEAGIKLMVGHTQHYLPANLRAKALIRSGQLGKLVAIHDTRHLPYYSDNRPRWFFEKIKAGGGIMMNLGAHSIDKIQWLTDSRIRKVKASLSYEGGIGDVEGSGVVFAETASGLGAVIVQSGYEGVAKDETELIFTGGMAKLISARGLWISRNGRYEPVTGGERGDSADPFCLQLQDLLGAIKGGAEPDSSGAYARSVIAALEAVYRSHETGVEQIVRST